VYRSSGRDKEWLERNAHLLLREFKPTKLFLQISNEDVSPTNQEPGTFIITIPNI
jgi:hypothetical protein